jgi:Protein of unknown function (DUF4231)
MISPEEYIEQRINDQIGWYDRKSATNKHWFKRLRFAEIVAAATIPFLSGFADKSFPIKIVIGCIGRFRRHNRIPVGFAATSDTLDRVSSHSGVAQEGEIFVSDPNGPLR